MPCFEKDRAKLSLINYNFKKAFFVRSEVSQPLTAVAAMPGRLGTLVQGCGALQRDETGKIQVKVWLYVFLWIMMWLLSIVFF